MLVQATTETPTIATVPTADARELSGELASEPSMPQSCWTSKDLSCLSAGLDRDTTECLERLSTKHLHIKCRAAIYRVGENFRTLFLVRSGSCKTMLLGKDGKYQIVDFHIAGDIIGIDGISSGFHECQATALEDMEVCLLPFDRIEDLARTSECFGHNLHKLLSRESGRAHGLMLMLGTMRAEKRLAAFLLDLSRRYQMCGYSSSEFILRMTREEIGSYLGLTLETVSRLFSRFQHDGVLEVRARSVKLDLTALRCFVDQPREPTVRPRPAGGACLGTGVVFAERKDQRPWLSRRQA